MPCHFDISVILNAISLGGNASPAVEMPPTRSNGSAVCLLVAVDLAGAPSPTSSQWASSSLRRLCRNLIQP